MSRITGLLILAVIASIAVGPGIAAATEDPRFETTVAENYVAPGQAESLSVTVLNDAEDADDRVEPATNVKAELGAGETPFTVTSGQRHLGTLRDGQPLQTQFAIDVPQDVESGVYTLPVRITYEYDDDERETLRTNIEVRVSDRATFTIVETSADVRVKSDGTMSVTVENIGSETASDATLQMESRSNALTFEGSQSGVRSIGELKPGAQKTVTYSIAATETAKPEVYPVIGTVKYDDDDGTRRVSTPLSGTISVSREQTFAVNNTGADLRVDRDGTLTVSVTNTGPEAVKNANLKLEPAGKSIHPKQTEFALGNLESGESVTAAYELRIDDDATANPRQLTFQLTYEDHDGDRKAADPKTVDVDIKPERPVYEVQTNDAMIPAGETETVSVQVTNTESEMLTSINAKAYTDAPVTITDDTAFVSELEPGESTIVRFRVQAPGDALTKDYPISLDFQYNEPDGDTKLTDTYDVPVSVTEGTTFSDTIDDYVETIDIPKNALLGGAAGAGITGLGFGTVVVFRRRRR